MALTEGALIVITPFICILPLYIHITCAVLRVPSKKGRWKVSICVSHLAVVFLFSSTTIAVYFNPSSSHSSEDTIATAMYILVSLMMNPLIYSLRNRDLKGALQKNNWQEGMLLLMKVPWIYHSHEYQSLPISLKCSNLFVKVSARNWASHRIQRTLQYF